MANEELGGDLVLGAIGAVGRRLRVIRDGRGHLGYRAETRKTQAPDERDWEMVIDDWSGGMGLSEVPFGQGYTKRFYYSKNFDSSVPRILRPSPVVQSLSVTPDVPGAIVSAFEDRLGGTDFFYPHYLPDGGSLTVAKINLASTPPALVERVATGNASDRGGQPVKAFSSSAADEVWHIPLSNGDRVRRRLTLPGVPVVGSGQTERWNLLASTTLYGMGSTELGAAGTTTMDWATPSVGQWATIGVAVLPVGGGGLPVPAAAASISGEGTVFTIPNLVSVNPNRFITVAIEIRNNSSQTVSSVTYGGVSLSQASAVSNGTNVRVEFFSLIAPALGFNDVVVTLSASAVATVGAITWADTNQSTALGTPSTNTGNTNTPTVAPASTTSQMVTDAAAILNQPTGDTWDVITTILGGARHFKRLGRLIWRAHTVNKISSFAIGSGSTPNAFETDSNHGADTEVGESDLNITALVALGRLLHIAKIEDLFSADEDANLQDLLSELPRNEFADAVQGFGSVPWHSKVFYPAGRQGLVRWTGFSAIGQGPDEQSENYGDAPNLSDQIRFGFHTAVERSPRWLWSLYSLSSASSYLMAGREVARGDELASPPHEIVWHPVLFGSFAPFTAQDEVLIRITWNGTNPRIWFGGIGANLSFIDLANDGSPYRPDADRGTSGTSEMFQSETDLGYPGTLKYIREAEAIVENGDSNAAWRIRYQLDGGSNINLGATFTATGVTQRFPTAGTSDLFRRFRPAEECVLGGALTDERAALKRVIWRGGYLPDTGRVSRYHVDVSEHVQLSSGGMDDRPVDVKIAELNSFKMTAVRALTDHLGIATNVVVEDVKEVDPQSVGLGPEKSVVELTLLEVNYS